MLANNKSIASICIAFLILFSGISIKLLRFEVADLTEEETCPACYGTSICRDIRENEISFDWTSFRSIFNNLFNVKNVYYGNYKNQRVVMKKLATNSELANFDQTVCSLTDVTKCSSRERISQIDLDELIKLELNNNNVTDPNVKIRLCPSIEKIDSLLGNIDGKPDDSEHLKYLWTTLKINPEPIILQILKANDDWPTPKYFGACGRLIIEEFVGPSLSEFEIEPWIKRAKIASSLLRAAHQLTFKNAEFAFYLTDISMDNIAVNDKDAAIFVDLENVIIVDRNPSDKVLTTLDSWNDIYSNDIEADCQSCLVFSMSDICEHKISDHNYYAICQHILANGQGSSTEILSSGFLQHPPDYILAKYPTLEHLLRQCSTPTRPSSRIESGIRLERLLNAIVQDNA